nr:translation initiation factor IF-2-like [Taeniopygia guttata]
MLSPVYTPAPLPWLPLPRRSARGRRKNFPPRKTREEKAIAGFRDLFQHATEILQIPPRSHAGAAVCVLWAGMERGSGTRSAQPALFAAFHVPTGGGRRAPAQPRAQGSNKAKSAFFLTSRPIGLIAPRPKVAAGLLTAPVPARLRRASHNCIPHQAARRAAAAFSAAAASFSSVPSSSSSSSAPASPRRRRPGLRARPAPAAAAAPHEWDGARGPDGTPPAARAPAARTRARPAPAARAESPRRRGRARGPPAGGARGGEGAGLPARPRPQPALKGAMPRGAGPAKSGHRAEGLRGEEPPAPTGAPRTHRSAPPLSCTPPQGCLPQGCPFMLASHPIRRKLKLRKRRKIIKTIKMY